MVPRRKCASGGRRKSKPLSRRRTFFSEVCEAVQHLVHDLSRLRGWWVQESHALNDWLTLNRRIGRSEQAHALTNLLPALAHIRNHDKSDLSPEQQDLLREALDHTSEVATKCLAEIPKRLREDLKDDEELYEAVDDILKAAEGGAPPLPGPNGWTTPDSPTRWANAFHCSLATFKRIVADKTIRAKPLTKKLYQVAVDDLPELQKAKYLPAK
jgi:hypothetical protein